MAKITPADCKKTLAGYASAFMENTEEATGLKRTGDWVRLRKYKDAAGMVCRDFLDKGIPMVVVLAEAEAGLVVRRERGLGPWEKAYEAHFTAWAEDWRRVEAWQEKVLWPSLRAEDFRFGVAESEGYGKSFFFQPVTCQPGEVWDQHTPLHHLFPEGMEEGEEAEATYTFYMTGGLFDEYVRAGGLVTDGGEGHDVTAWLVKLGFVHDRALDGRSGS